MACSVKVFASASMLTIKDVVAYLGVHVDDIVTGDEGALYEVTC